MYTQKIANFDGYELSHEFDTSETGAKEAVILSGNGSDGSAGLASINKQGGSIFVQDPSTAKFSGMPDSAINTGFADFILSPVKIATKLNKFFVNTIKQHSNNHQNIVINDAKLLQILQVVKDTTFIDFLDYKPSTIVRRISKRVLLTKSKSIDEYKFIPLNKTPMTSEYLEKNKLLLIGYDANLNLLSSNKCITKIYLYFPKGCLCSFVVCIIIMIVVIDILRFTRTKAKASHIPH
jgi:hypothetical protein